MMRLYQPIFLVLTLLFVGGCASFEQGVLVARSQVLASPDFAEMTMEDVVNAKKLALLTDDKLSLLCWDYIEWFVGENAPEGGVETGEVVGPLSAYQKARNVRRTVVEVEISDALRIACGPMLTDSMSAIGRVGIRIIL